LTISTHTKRSKHTHPYKPNCSKHCLHWQRKELWEELREIFSKGNPFPVSNLLQEINSIKQGERIATNTTQTPIFYG